MGASLRKIQTNFTAGEISKRLKGRVDFKAYYNGAETVLNMIVRVLGGVYRRPGSYYVAEVADSTKDGRLWPFKYSTVQNYMLEFGDQKLRIYRSRGQVVESSKAISAATQANPAQITVIGHGYSTGDQIYIDEVLGMTQLNGKRYTVTVIDPDTLTLGVDSTSYSSFGSGGLATRIYTVSIPWQEADLSQLKFTQSADVLYVTHPDYAPQKISRTADASWSVDEYINLDGPYLDLNKTDITLTPGATTGTGITLTASASLFASTDVGRLVRIFGSGTWGYAKIVGYSSATSVTIDIKSDFGSTSATKDWRLGAWSATTGYPAVSAFFQERLIFANTADQPSTFWGSKSSDFENHAPSDVSGTVTDDSAINYTISDDQVNAIVSMSAGKSLLIINTSDSVHTAYGGNSNGALVAITPTNITVTRENSFGAASDLQSLKVGDAIMYAATSKKRIRKIKLDGNTTDKATDITLLSEHILSDGLNDMTFQKEIENIAWFTRDDGQFIGNTIEDEQEVNAWHRHIIGGAFGDGIAKVMSIGSIPNPEIQKGYDVWLIAKRTIGGVTRQYVEYLGDPFDPESEGQSSGFFVDSGLTYNGFVSATLTPGATTGDGIVFTASANVFSSNMVGDKIYQYDENERRVASAEIVGYSSATSITVDITKNFSSTNVIPSGSWCIARNRFSGLHHLEGETVQVNGMGAALPDKVVSSGAIELDRHYGRIHVGYGSRAMIKGLPIEEQSFGTAQGLLAKIENIFVSVYQSLGLKYGASEDHLEELSLRSGADAMDAPPPLNTKLIKLSWPSGIETDPVPILIQDKPLPLEILHYVTEIRYHG